MENASVVHEKPPPTRIHLLAHANPPARDIARFGFTGVAEYLNLIRAALPPPFRLTATRSIFEAVEDDQRGGRRDDAVRIRDLQRALNDPNTLAIVAANGGGYMQRILPHLDFSHLARRRTPLWALGFSELTTFVNVVASYPQGRGDYWLCPNYLAWKIEPVDAARAAFAGFWRNLPTLLFRDGFMQPAIAIGDGIPTEIVGELVSGRAKSGPVKLIGGCLSVLVAMLAGPLARRLRSRGKWLFLEDLKEESYRIDRYLAALKFAGWFDQIGGVLVGDFHIGAADLRPAVVELLRFHLPTARRLPIVTTRAFGHVWPMTPVPVNRVMHLKLQHGVARLVP